VEKPPENKQERERKGRKQREKPERREGRRGKRKQRKGKEVRNVHHGLKGDRRPCTVTHIRATERHLPYGITQCYLPQDTSEFFNPSQTDWCSICLPRRDKRLT